MSVFVDRPMLVGWVTGLCVTGIVASTTSRRISAIGGDDAAILAKRHEVYQTARERNPARWSGSTRNWNRVGEVWLSPERTDQEKKAA